MSIGIPHSPFPIPHSALSRRDWLRLSSAGVLGCSLSGWMQAEEPRATGGLAPTDVSEHIEKLGNPLVKRYPDGSRFHYARNISALQGFDGKLYVGHGDWGANSGPTDTRMRSRAAGCRANWMPRMLFSRPCWSIAFRPAEVADHIGQIAGQNLPQPGGLLSNCSTLELGLVAYCLRTATTERADVIVGRRLFTDGVERDVYLDDQIAVLSTKVPALRQARQCTC